MVAIFGGWALAAPLVAGLTESFAAKNYDTALAALVGDQQAQEHSSIEVKAPDIAEDSSKVPIQVYAPVDGVQKISLLIEANPAPLISVVHIDDRTEPYISIRAKMRETSRVTAIVHTANGVFRAERKITVTAGGCG